MMDEAGVDRAILVPPSLEGDRNDLCLEAARNYPRRFAVMGRLQLDSPNAPERLKRMKSERGMLGVRLTFHRDNDRPLLTNGLADWFWPGAEALGVAVMVHAPERLPQIAEIAGRHPKLPLIIDHMGFARETSDDKSGAGAGADRVLALAKYPNVSRSKCPHLHAIRASRILSGICMIRLNASSRASGSSVRSGAAMSRACSRTAPIGRR